MLKLEIRMNEEKILREGKYSLGEIYTVLDRAFLRHDLHRETDDNRVLVYVGNGQEQDYGNFWKIIWGLAKKDWFMENVERWLWYNSDDGTGEEDFSVEDVLSFCQKKHM